MREEYPELVSPIVLYKLRERYENISKDNLENLLKEIKNKTEKAYVELSKDEFVGMRDNIAIYSGPWKDRILENTIDLKINDFYCTPRDSRISFNFSNKMRYINNSLKYTIEILNNVQEFYESGHLNVNYEIIGYLDKISPRY